MQNFASEMFLYSQKRAKSSLAFYEFASSKSRLVHIYQYLTGCERSLFVFGNLLIRLMISSHTIIVVSLLSSKQSRFLAFKS